MLRTLCSFLCLSAFAMAQDPAARCAEALLRGNSDEVVLAEVEDVALRARLQAALGPLAQRPAAMLAVARQFPNHPEADAAILAGAAAVLALRDDGNAVPELMAWIYEENRDDPDVEELPLAPVVEGLWKALEHRLAGGGDPATLNEGKRLLELCRISRFGFLPARVSPRASWALPERNEDLLFRAWPRPAGPSGWEELDRLAPPAVERPLSQGAREPMPGLGTGDWLVELASTTTPWRGLRAVEVSDLDVVALVDRGVLALGAWRGGQPVESAEFRLSRGQTEMVLPFAGATTVAWPLSYGEGGDLVVQSGGASAWTRLPAPRHVRDHLDSWQAHLMLDRPLYRPGETIQGRLVLRRCRFDGEGLDAVAHTEVADGRWLTMYAFADTAHEMRRVGRTDAHGVFAFELPVPPDAESGWANFEFGLGRGREPIRVHREDYACQIANFRRPALLLEVAGPDDVALDGADPPIVLQATWASGSPAAGIAVSAAATTWRKPGGKFVARHRLTTDRAGCATLTVALSDLQPGEVQVQFSVESPDGRREQLQHEFRVYPAGPRAPEPGYSWRRWQKIHVDGPEVAIVGDPCPVTVGGPPGACVLLVAGRGQGARVQQLQLDEHGEGHTAVTPTRAEWPALDLVVAMAGASDEARIPLQRRATTAPRIEVPATARPGEEVTCTVATGVPGTVVTVAVVDERVFSLAPDRLFDPTGRLRPYAPYPDWRRAASVPAILPSQLLGAMLEDGRVPGTDDEGELQQVHPAGGPAAGPAGPRQPQEVRTDFRTTAAFLTVVADADGTAVVPFTLPDDLTTWRVTVVGVAPDGIGFLERRALVTRLPLAAEPLLPRVLRQGDSVAMTVAIDRAATATADSDLVRLTASSEGAALAIGGGDVQLTVPSGSTGTADVTLRGVVAGEADLSMSATLGPHGDRSRRAVSVQRDVVAHSAAVASSGTGRVEVSAPEDVDPENGLHLVVLGGSSAAWQAIEQELTSYPYGCAEQTLSRLLPYFAAIRGARAHGTPPPVADEEFRLRLKAGLQRLRRLQESRGGGFAFWPSGGVDDGITALVLHGLAVVREGGIDPAQHGLFCDPERTPFSTALLHLSRQGGVVTTPAGVTAAELAAACLRSVPKSESARAAVAAVLDGGDALPPGLLARTGIALFAAGDLARAERCLQRLAALEHSSALAPGGFPGEDPLAVRALQLELHCLLHSGSATASNLVGDVLLQCLQGFSSTYAEACALSALALALPPDETQSFAVQIVAGAVERTVELTAANGYTARFHVPFAPRCTALSPPERQVLLRVVGERTERASDHAPWQAPLVVERELCRKRRSSREIPDGDPLEPIGDAPPKVGEVLWLRVSVRAPVPMRYVVVECPLPAGFELPDEPRWIERFDDRVAFTFDRVDHDATSRTFAVVPTMAGTVGWPPAVAAPMYVGNCEGGCAGTVLTVAPAGARERAASTATCFLKLTPPVDRSPSLPQLAREATAALREAWKATDLPADRRAIETQFEVLETLASAEGQEEVLSALTTLLRKLSAEDQEPFGAAPQVALHRVILLTRAQVLKERLVSEIFCDLEREAPDWSRSYRIRTLWRALQEWPVPGERERLLVRALRYIRERVRLDDEWFYELDDFLYDLEGPARTPELRGELLSLLTSADPEVSAQVVELLPRADVACLPPAVLLDALDADWPDGMVRMLLATPRGREELRRRLPDPTFVHRHVEHLVADLPGELWRDVPLAAHAELAGEFDPEFLLDNEGFGLASHLAGTDISTAALQQELVATQDVEWRLALVQALHQRGVHDLGDATVADDPAWVWWSRALEMGSDQANLASQLLGDLQCSPTTAGDHGRWVLRRFALQILVAHGTAAHLAPVAGELDEEQCRAVFDRLDSEGRGQLLASATEEFSALPTPVDTADCVGLWDYGERFDDLYWVVEPLCQSEVGAAFVRARVEDVSPTDDALDLRESFADAMGLDRDTLQAPVDEPWLPVLRSALRNGLQHPWSAAERQQLERLRRLRGVW